MKAEKTVKASAWKEPRRGTSFFYKLQIENIDGRSLEKIKKICVEWKCGGYGWNIDNKYKILLFSKSFKSKAAWLKWAKQFPYKLVELNDAGKPLRSKLGSDFQSKTKDKKGKNI
tara:strand:+ start:693 stop:1037 length:345 start_codon:yes stop_codon:yes gene_type:complete